MGTALDTPWTLAGIAPAPPVLLDGPVEATAAPLGAVTSAATVELATPWAATDVRLPARETALPWLATGAVLPTPRPDADLAIGQRKPGELLG